jgi:hypothetical protein
MSAPTFASLYRISVRRADGGISFRPRTHDISRPSADPMKVRMELFSNKFKDKKGPASAAAKCKGKKFRAFRGCLRSEGKAIWAGS